ncbi:SMC family ATPase [candidate division KSB1 bacterium]|nr:SMC family ATPase [candidate division KSB1 bacterium]
MIIKNIKLENYRRFSTLELEFPENLIGIIGKNGTGKSTIIEALGWVLYGNRLGRTDKQEIRTHSSDEKDKCSVEMEFNYGGHEYRIVRKLKGKNAVSEAAVYRDGNSEPEAVQDRGVNEYIEKLLHLDYDSFTTSVFAQQKDLAKLSTFRPEERRQSINRLIGLDKIDEARSQVRQDRNKKQNFLAGKESNLKNIDELKDQKNILEEQKRQKENRSGELLKDVENKSAQLKESKTEYEKQTIIKDEFSKMEILLGKLLSRLDENEKMLDRSKNELVDIQTAEQTLNSVHKELSGFEKTKNQKDRMDQLAVKYSSLNSKQAERKRLGATLEQEEKRGEEYTQIAVTFEVLEKMLKKNYAAEKLLEEKINGLRVELQSVKGELKSKQNEGQKEKIKLEQIEKVGSGGQCPLCGQKLGAHYTKVVNDLNELLQSLRNEYKDISQKNELLSSELEKQELDLRKLRSERETLLKDSSRAREANKNLTRIQEAIENFSKQLKLLDQEINNIGEIEYDESGHNKIKLEYEKLLTLKQKAAGLEERVSRKDKVIQEIGLTEKTVTDITDEIEKTKIKQTDLDYNEKKFQKIKKVVDDKTENLNQAKERLSEVREVLAGINKEIDGLSADIKQQQHMRREIEKAKNEIFYLNVLDEHFGQFRLELAGRIRPLIALRASELLSLTTMSRYNLLELDKDYNIQIYDGNSCFPIQRFSGGEQDLANLCLRIAISQIVAERSGGDQINFIVLDEIFGSQDAERRDLILNALGKLSSQFRQIFIITHIEPIKDMLPVIIEVSVVNDQISKAQLM